MDETWDYPRETMEYVFFEELLINGVAPVVDVEYALTRGLDRPMEEDWGPVVEQGGKKCFLLSPQPDSGRLKVWVRVPEIAERTVVEVGYINIT